MTPSQQKEAKEFIVEIQFVIKSLDQTEIKHLAIKKLLKQINEFLVSLL